MNFNFTPDHLCSFNLFHRGILPTALMPTLHEVTGEFLELLEKRGKDDVDVKPTLQLAFSEYLARIGAGIKPGILTDEKPEDNQFYKR